MKNPSNLELLIFGYYIKYSKLQELCNLSIADIESDAVDIYIDLYDLLKPVYTKDVFTNKKLVLVSHIINLIAHYRRYFLTRHRLWARIFLVYADQTNISHKQYYQSFGDYNFRNTINFSKNNEFINSQLELIKILCGYIDDAYYIHKKCTFAVFTFNNISKSNIKSIIVSKDKYTYQVPALLNNAVIYRPKKYNGEDISYFINKNMVYQAMFNKIKRDKTINYLKYINSELLSVLLTLTGLPEYNIVKIFNATTAINKLYSAINNNSIINAYNSDIARVYNSLQISDVVNYNIYENRFNAIDIVNQNRLYSTTAESLDITWYINLNDPKTLKDINNKYFIDNPLDLNSL